TSNASLCTKGCRIVVGWNKDVVNLLVVAQSSRAIHTKITHRADNKTFFCTFIYVCNDPKERHTLVADLEYHKVVVSGSPWILLGDFNVALNMEDSFSGSSRMNSATCNLLERVTRLRVELDAVQRALDLDPSNNDLMDEEAAYLQAFDNAKMDEERFLRQKAKIDWLEERFPRQKAKIDWLEVGDSNSVYFHKSIKSRNQRSHIDVITNADNVEVSGNAVPDVFVSHYHSFLGATVTCGDLD
nr:RNA-directed DNA polymerase, eukaryota, reverse transcriptase zinc-binding domain protein [Tanacetum cinerariifolium]